MQRRPLILLAATAALSCQGFGTLEDTGDSWQGATWTGTHQLLLGENQSAIYCDVQWTTQGTAAETGCTGCDFVFDLSFTLEDTSTSNGTCDFRMVDERHQLAYAESFQTYGASVGEVGTDGQFQRLGTASLSGETFTYSYDTLFDSYGGYYEVLSEGGAATLTLRPEESGQDTGGSDTSTDARAPSP